MKFLDTKTLYGKVAEWEAQALEQVKKHVHDKEPTEWYKWWVIWKDRRAFKFDIFDDTIDAEPVIRCKDCKHWKKDTFQIGDNFVGICRRKAAIRSEFPCTADGFCSWAERRKK